jgi:hypothetical protein
MGAYLSMLDSMNYRNEQKNILVADQYLSVYEYIGNLHKRSSKMRLRVEWSAISCSD